jgi:hypothetical protein
MKRSTFLKSIVLAVTAPFSITEQAKKKAKPNDGTKPYFNQEKIQQRITELGHRQNLSNDLFYIYVPTDQKVRRGDLIRSDMGDMALVSAITLMGPHLQMLCKPVTPLTYHFKDPVDFTIMEQVGFQNEMWANSVKSWLEPTIKMPSNATIAAVIR